MAEAAAKDSAGFASPNFSHLAKVVPLPALEGVKAERYVFSDPIIALSVLGAADSVPHKKPQRGEAEQGSKLTGTPPTDVQLARVLAATVQP